MRPEKEKNHKPSDRDKVLGSLGAPYSPLPPPSREKLGCSQVDNRTIYQSLDNAIVEETENARAWCVQL